MLLIFKNWLSAALIYGTGFFQKNIYSTTGLFFYLHLVNEMQLILIYSVEKVPTTLSVAVG